MWQQEKDREPFGFRNSHFFLRMVSIMIVVRPFPLSTISILQCQSGLESQPNSLRKFANQGESPRNGWSAICLSKGPSLSEEAFSVFWSSNTSGANKLLCSTIKNLPYFSQATEFTSWMKKINKWRFPYLKPHLGPLHFLEQLRTLLGLCWKIIKIFCEDSYCGSYLLTKLSFLLISWFDRF